MIVDNVVHCPVSRQMYAALERFMTEVRVRPRVAVVLGSGDTDLSVRDSSPGTEPEDHMEKSWLVDKGGVLARLPPGCHAIGGFYKWEIIIFVVN